MALMANDFRLLGEAMVMSVIQGGPAPNFLNESIFQYIAKQDLSAENCQNEAFKSAAIKLSSCITDDVLHETILANEILDVLQNVRYTGVPQKESIKSSKDIVQSICIKDQISNSVAQLQQLQEGLSNCNLLDAIRKQPHVWKAVFVPSDIFKFTADEFLDHLQPQYSSFQALKMKEVDTFKFFNDVIQKFEDGKDTNIST
ncbi:uncharacterized protein LOC124435915 [Xenia sp. Carnegie-2017]|uniref:uncharacterized protein LOC124435915 n=1 Tax=Xenia sp. Carnegie-2017 TaxID=2897299 RepID=UPI001F04B2C4|nr:uncharacterized protein LOC124435915 [Xenia sp. Carnegie-2017]